jgi:hypothetical protein
MRIVAFDPGETTGYCDAEVSDDGSFRVITSCTIAWSARFRVTRELLQGMHLTVPLLPDAIIVESFRLYYHKKDDQVGNDFPSSQFRGIIETFAWELGLLDKVVLQPASVMSRVAILAEHVPQVIRSEHARDAYRHLRYYVVTKVK